MLKLFCVHAIQSIERNLLTSFVNLSKSFRILLHSAVEHVKLDSMEVKVVPALKDNYMYLVIDKATKEAAVVDPVEPAELLRLAKEENANLTKILTTHHHWDHASGNEKFLELANQQLEIYGADYRIPALTHKVLDGALFNIGKLSVRCLFTPCHTAGHVCYYIASEHDERVVFTGDTLFQGGCGRFFEGTAEQMYCALCNKLSALPSDTKVFCGHEYTLQNLAYGMHVEPTNELLKKRLEWAKKQRSAGLTTLPSTIGDEKQWNPFMRVNEPSLQQYVGESDPIKIMALLRKEKDTFKIENTPAAKLH